MAKRHVDDLDFYLSPCKLIDRERKTDKSRFAHVNHKPDLMCKTSDFWKQSTSRRRGLIAHEIGHLLLIKKGNVNHTEHEADLEVKKMLGLKIRYDKKGIQKL
jgi:hypothetical protein